MPGSGDFPISLTGRSNVAAIAVVRYRIGHGNAGTVQSGLKQQAERQNDIVDDSQNSRKQAGPKREREKKTNIRVANLVIYICTDTSPPNLPKETCVKHAFTYSTTDRRSTSHIPHRKLHQVMNQKIKMGKSEDNERRNMTGKLFSRPP